MPSLLKRIFSEAADRAAEKETQEDLDKHLTEALDGYDYDLIEDLVLKGASVHVKDIRDETPLHKAAFANKARLAEVLIDKGAILDSLAIDGTTPLHKAAFSGSDDVAKILLRAGANPLLTCDLGDSPAAFARHEGELRVAKLIEDGVGLYHATRLKKLHRVCKRTHHT